MEQAADHSVDNIIDNHFLRKTNEIYERYVFNTRKQKARETVDDYIAALCILASTCNFCDCLKDSLLRDRIVLGIKDSSTRKRLLQEADLNLETCIAMCRAAEATSPSQPVKTVTWTEDTTAVQAGSVSSGDQRPGKKQDFSLSLRCCDSTASPDEAEMSEVNFNTELDDSDDDSALRWTTEHQSSGFSWNTAGHNKLEPAWSMEEDSPDQPSAVYSTSQPMSGNTSGSPLSLNTSHECYLCSAAFVLVSSLELHLASVHGEKLHMVLPGSSTPDRCDAGNTDIGYEVDSLCNRKTTKDTVDDHDTDDKDGNKRRRQYVCDVCEKSFTTSSKLKRHYMIHSGIKPFECDVCRKRFRDASYLRTHKLTHSDDDQTHSGCKPFVCDMCSKRFTRIYALRTHKLTHSVHKPFACDMCDKSYIQASHLKIHKLTHSSHDAFVCDVCSKTFTRGTSLIEHKKIHARERLHNCPHCESGFESSQSLRHHIKSAHGGAKPHLCDICGAAFSQPFKLSKHKRVHSGEKPYMCSECGREFADSSNLAKHRLTHTGEKPHVCPDCGKGFADSSSLRQHRMTHTGEKPHSCPHCPSAFKLLQHLKMHIQRKHQNISKSVGGKKEEVKIPQPTVGLVN